MIRFSDICIWPWHLTLKAILVLWPDTRYRLATQQKLWGRIHISRRELRVDTLLRELKLMGRTKCAEYFAMTQINSRLELFCLSTCFTPELINLRFLDCVVGVPVRCFALLCWIYWRIVCLIVVRLRLDLRVFWHQLALISCCLSWTLIGV